MQHFVFFHCHKQKTYNMYKIICLVLLTVFAGCEKPEDIIIDDLDITATNTPKTLTQWQEIVSKITCWLPNGCYDFKKFEIIETGNKQFQIKAIASYINTVACIQALIKIDTSLVINTPTKGQYLLHFYNDNTLFNTDTVNVN
jgi:hypothetical protein